MPGLRERDLTDPLPLEPPGPDGFFDEARILVNGESAWANLSSHGNSNNTTHHEDRAWVFNDVALSTRIADKKVKLRFELDANDDFQLGGWTLDDVCIVANTRSVCGDGERSYYEQCDSGDANADVADAVRSRFGSFYAALFDRTIEKNPGAVVTEYAWDANTCDPCPGPTLGQEDFVLLGADVLDGPAGKATAYNGYDFVLTRLHARYGKTITEDLVFMAHKMGFRTGVDLEALRALTTRMEAIVGRPIGGRTRAYFDKRAAGAAAPVAG